MSYETEGNIRRSTLLPKGQNLLSSPSSDIKTGYDIVRYAQKHYPENHRVFGERAVIKTHEETKELKKIIGGVEKTEKKVWKYQELGPYVWTSISETIKEISQLGSGLINIGLSAKDKLTIFHPTR
jgi:long-chain acyl-CoA synthetase